jgi:hypothetical protein
LRRTGRNRDGEGGESRKTRDPMVQHDVTLSKVFPDPPQTSRAAKSFQGVRAQRIKTEVSAPRDALRFPHSRQRAAEIVETMIVGARVTRDRAPAPLSPRAGRRREMRGVAAGNSRP